MKFLIFSADFKPMDGGVADYAYNLAWQFNKRALLYDVITYIHQTEDYGFSVSLSNMQHQRKLYKRWGDNIGIIRKFNTFLHKLILYKSAFKDLYKYWYQRRELIIINCSYYGYFQEIFANTVRIMGFRYFQVLHGLDIIRNMQTNPELFKKITSKAELLIFNSLATRSLFYNKLSEKKGMPSYILYPGLNFQVIDNIELFSLHQLEEKWNLNLKGKTIISSITRLIKRKGLDIAIQAIKEIVKVHEDVIFLIGGKGEEYDNLKNLIWENSLQDHVILLGFINDREKYSLLKHSSIFLMPNHSNDEQDWEGFGISFIEASYFGNVVVGGSHGGAGEAIMNHQTGYTLDFDRADSNICLLQEILTHLLAQPEAGKALQENGIKYAHNFDWDLIIRKFLTDINYN